MSVKASVPEVCLDSPGAAYTGVNDKLDAMVGKFEETKRKLERAFSLPTSVGTEVPKQEWSCSVPRIKASNGRTASTPIGIHLFDEQTRHVFGITGSFWVSLVCNPEDKSLHHPTPRDQPISQVNKPLNQKEPVTKSNRTIAQSASLHLNLSLGVVA